MRSPSAFLATVGLVGGGFIGAATAYDRQYGLYVLAAVLLGVVVIARPANLAVVAVASVFVVQRVGALRLAPGSQGGISYSDVFLAVAVVLAIPAVIGSSEVRRLRAALVGLGAYLSCLLPTVILHPSARAEFEWTHRLLLIGGALLVGAWVAQEGLTRPALRGLTIVACLVAAAAIEFSISSGFAPASPIGLNKNFIGALLAAVVVLVAIAPGHVGLSPRRQTVVLLVLATGLVASQSRGAMLAAVAGLLVAFTLDPRGHSRWVRGMSVLVAVVLAGFAYVSIRDQLNQSQAEARIGSIGVRSNVESVTRGVWRTSPITGVGLKYYNTGNFGHFAVAANNDVDNELAESGIIGLIGFVALQGTVIAAGARRRRSGKLVAAAVGIVVAHLLHGMVDIYWSAGVVTLPFLILGIAMAKDDELDSQFQSDRASAGRPG
jgi:hypothetical protein